MISNSNSFTMDERIVATFPLIIRMVCQSEQARG